MKRIVLRDPLSEAPAKPARETPFRARTRASVVQPRGRSATAPARCPHFAVGTPGGGSAWAASALVAIVILLVTGCGSEPDAPASSHPTGSASTDAVEFHRDVAPIIWKNCTPCHREGEAAPFEFLEYASVKRRANQIVDVVETGFMPPWLPSRHASYPDLKGARSLTEAEIDTLRRWAQAGAPEGAPIPGQEPPRFESGWTLGEPDLVVRLPQPYLLPAGGRDVFRNFSVPVPLDRARFVRGIDLRPTCRPVVHHAVLLVDPNRTARRREALDPEPGFEGMDTLGAAQSPEGHLIGWTPGKVAKFLPEGTSFRLDRGTDLVLQLHLRPSGKEERVDAEIGLYFTDEPPTRLPMVIRLGSKTIDIPAGESDYTITDQIALPVDVTLIGLYPHAHYLATDMQCIAILPDQTKQPLFRIPSWDFDWQDDYRFERPVPLPAGTVVAMRYKYDNSATNVRNPSSPPKPVRYGPETDDEMGDLWLQVLPRGPVELATLRRATGYKELQANIEWLSRELARTPDDPSLLHDLGYLHESSGDRARATALYERAITLESDRPDTLFNLGRMARLAGDHARAIEYLERAHAVDRNQPNVQAELALARSTAGDAERALREIESAARSDPTSAILQRAWAHILQRLGRLPEAAVKIERARTLEPLSLRAHTDAADIYLAQNDAKKAYEALTSALRLDPTHAPSRSRVGMILGSLGRMEPAIEQFQLAIALDPYYLSAYENLALAYERAGRADDARRCREELRKRQAERRSADP